MAEAKKSAPPSAKGDAPTAPGVPQSEESIAQNAEESKPGYYAILGRVRYDNSLPPMARLLCAEISALIGPEGYCWASNSRLAELYDISISQVSRLLNTLEKAGYIRREVVRDKATQTVALRKIYLSAAAAPACEPLRKNAHTHTQKCGEGIRKNAQETNLSITSIPPISPRRGSAQAGPEFERFWQAYPPRHGVRRGKAEARRQWEKLGAEKDPALCQRILAALEAYRRSDDVARGYAVDAVRWLRNRRWEDEQVSAPPVRYDGGEVLEDLFDGCV